MLQMYGVIILDNLLKKKLSEKWKYYFQLAEENYVNLAVNSIMETWKRLSAEVPNI